MANGTPSPEEARQVADHKQALIDSAAQAFLLDTKPLLAALPTEGEDAFIRVAGVGQGALLLAADIAIRTGLPKAAFVQGAGAFFDKMAQALNETPPR